MKKIFLLLLFLYNQPVFGVDSDQLSEINEKISAYQQQLIELNLKYKEGNTNLEKLQGALKALGDKQAKTTKALKKIAEDKLMLETYLNTLQDEIQRVGDAASKRLRALYIYRRGSGQGSLFQVDSIATFSRASYYAGKLRSFDEDKVAELKALHLKREGEGKKLNELKNKEGQSLKELSLQKEEIQNRVKERSALLSVLVVEKGKINQALGGLKAQALRLETVLRSLTGGEDSSVIDIAPSKKTKTEALTQFVGTGLKSNLVKPFSGKLLFRFGKYKDPDFGNEITPHRGVEFQGKGEILAIEDGKVAFVGIMPQFGNVVILDHGSRDYSLYGRLEDVEVNNGTIISKGDFIGRASDPDMRGRTFYFEIRREGNPVDPTKLMKLS